MSTKKRKKKMKKKTCLKLLIKLLRGNEKIAKEIPQKFWNKHF